MNTLDKRDKCAKNLTFDDQCKRCFRSLFCRKIKIGDKPVVLMCQECFILYSRYKYLIQAKQGTWKMLFYNSDPHLLCAKFEIHHYPIVLDLTIDEILCNLFDDEMIRIGNEHYDLIRRNSYRFLVFDLCEKDYKDDVDFKTCTLSEFCRLERIGFWKNHPRYIIRECLSDLKNIQNLSFKILEHYSDSKTWIFSNTMKFKVPILFPTLKD